MRFLCCCAVMLLPSIGYAQQNRLYVGFGEVPEIANSFKPAIGFSRRYDYFEWGVVYQFEDRLDRGKESFNAQFGQDGLRSAKETTGHRAMLQGKVYPWREYFYISFGVMNGGKDKEKMVFDSRNRQIGANRYDSSLDVTISRDQSTEPVLGVGVDIPVTDSLSFTMDFSMASFGAVPDPKIELSTSATVAQADLAALEAEIRDNYKSNFHNRYHLFNVGVQYSF